MSETLGIHDPVSVRAERFQVCEESFPLGTLVTSLSKGCLRLYNLGDCFMVPGRDDFDFKVVGEACPD